MMVVFPMMAFADQTIIKATMDGDIKTVKSFLEAGGNVNTLNPYGGSALLFAARGGYTDIAKLLLEYKADVNIHGSYAGTTALMWAAQHGSTDIVKLLMDTNVEINAKNHKGQTALFFAVENGHTEIINILKKHGAK